MTFRLSGSPSVITATHRSQRMRGGGALRPHRTFFFLTSPAAVHGRFVFRFLLFFFSPSFPFSPHCTVDPSFMRLLPSRTLFRSHRLFPPFPRRVRPFGRYPERVPGKNNGFTLRCASTQTIDLALEGGRQRDESGGGGDMITILKGKHFIREAAEASLSVITVMQKDTIVKSALICQYQIILIRRNRRNQRYRHMKSLHTHKLQTFSRGNLLCRRMSNICITKSHTHTHTHTLYVLTESFKIKDSSSYKMLIYLFILAIEANDYTCPSVYLLASFIRIHQGRFLFSPSDKSCAFNLLKRKVKLMA